MGAVETDKLCLGVQHHRGAPGVEAEGAGREADTELQHLDPEGAGGGEVAELVDHHQNHQHQGECAYGEENEKQGFHFMCPVSLCPPDPLAVPSPSRERENR